MPELLVTEISVSIGETIPLGDFRSARIDISNTARLSEPVAPGSVDYRRAHKQLVEAVDAMKEKAKANLIEDEK